jgi:hypothetical protein
MPYAGTFSYSWAADISIGSGNASPMRHELQNGDPLLNVWTREDVDTVF